MWTYLIVPRNTERTLDDAPVEVGRQIRHEQRLRLSCAHFFTRGRVARFIVRLHLGDLYTESGQTSKGTFSAVSKQKFASKYLTSK